MLPDDWAHTADRPYPSICERSAQDYGHWGSSILMPGGFTAFPGYQMKITNIVESGDWVMVESRFAGTHTGP